MLLGDFSDPNILLDSCSQSFTVACVSPYPSSGLRYGLFQGHSSTEILFRGFSGTQWLPLIDEKERHLA